MSASRDRGSSAQSSSCPRAALFVQRPEPPVDLGIRATAKPPLELTRHGSRIVRRHRWEPETQHVVVAIHEGLPGRSRQSPGSAGFSTISATATRGAISAIIPQTFHERVAIS